MKEMYDKEMELFFEFLIMFGALFAIVVIAIGESIIKTLKK